MTTNPGETKVSRVGQILREILRVPYEAVRDFVWVDFRAGWIDLRGVTRPAQFLVVLGFALLGAMVVALLFNGVWRSTFALLPQLSGPAGRGALVPDALVPVSFFMLTLAWTYALNGALHSHWAIRVLVVVLYLLFALGWLGGAGVALLLNPATFSLDSAWDVAVLLLLLVAVPMIFLIRRRAPARPAMEWLLLFGCVALFFALAQFQAVDAWRNSGLPILLDLLQTNLAALTQLTSPLLLLAGINIALFARGASEWVSDAVTQRLPYRAALVILGIALALRVWTVTSETFENANANGWRAELVALAGAFGVVVLVALAWFLATRWRTPGAEWNGETLTRAMRGAILWLILAWSAVLLVMFLLFAVVLALPVTPGGRVIQGALHAVIEFLNGSVLDAWLVFVVGASIVVALWLARRGANELALYLLCFGLVNGWNNLTNPRGALSALYFQGTPERDVWMMVLILAAAAMITLRRAWNVERVGALLFLVVLTGLLRQADFISSPLSPFFGFAGIGFVAFGLVYDAVTAGAWANVSTPALPRPGRIFLYLGYVLLSVTVVNWALASHVLSDIDRLTGGVAWQGMQLFGMPLLFAIFAVTLARILRNGQRAA